MGAASDLRELRIPNLLSIAAVVLFIGCAPFVAFDEILLRLLSVAAVFAVGFMLFALRILGGGDVKLLSALMLFIPTSSLMAFGYVFSASMLVGIVLIAALRKRPVRMAEDWASVQQPNTLPMGISIAFAGLTHLSLLSWWHF